MDALYETHLRTAISYCIENNDVNTATNRIMEFIRDENEAINYTHSCTELRDEYLQPELDKYKNIKIERTKGKSDMQQLLTTPYNVN